MGYDLASTRRRMGVYSNPAGSGWKSGNLRNRGVLNMKLTGKLFSALLILATSTLVVGADIQKSQILDARTAFARLKALAGEWEGTYAVPDMRHGFAAAPGTPAHVQYRVAANGSAVIETYNAGMKSEMITVYHMDGPDKLMMTHYCALGNQPVMQFEKSSNPNELKFVFAGGTNFDPAHSVHVHEGVMRLLSDDKIESTFNLYDEGMKAAPVPVSLTRQK
jgi:hypothetical protein